MSGISVTKELIKQAYPRSVKWASKVNAMSEAQATAIYLRMKREGKIR